MGKTIVSKMGLFDILAILLPGIAILWGVSIIAPNSIQFVESLPGMDSAFWWTTAFVICALVVGTMLHAIMDTLWHLCHLRNCPWLLRLSIRFLQFNHKKAYPVDRLEGLRTSATIEKDYYENYEAVYEKCGSKLSAVDKQVVMFRNLILPASFLMYAICKNGVNVAPIFANHLWWWVIGIGVLFFIFAIARQMRVYYVYYDYFAFMKTPETKDPSDSETIIQKFWHWLCDNIGGLLALLVIAVSFISLIYLTPQDETITTRCDTVISFCASLLATIVGIFLVFWVLHPHISLPDQLVVDKSDKKDPRLKVTIENIGLFKIYQVDAFFDYIRYDAASNDYKTMRIDIQKPTVSVIFNRLAIHSKKVYTFKSEQAFKNWDDTYSMIRCRIVAVHGVSNMTKEFERTYTKAEIQGL